jgi:hypothetical protein
MLSYSPFESPITFSRVLASSVASGILSFATRFLHFQRTELLRFPQLCLSGRREIDR